MSNVPLMKLRLRDLVFFLALGAVASLVGDHSHVVTGTTEYFTDAVPFVWSSPIWFPVLVALATVSLAELRLHLPSPRTDVTARQGLAGVAAVLGIYVTTALIHTAPAVPATALIVTLAIITWCALGDGPSVVCGLLAAIIGPAVEIVIAKAGLFAYHEACDSLFGVAPWLVPLYFAFGVVVALLAEIGAKR
ncbi:diacylglycerol-binding protein [Mycolicibacterium celeriflavum]|uniref:diacylglycerol-binding protein n=1 Tax=Mycolicibacterium celeriflavum TaxID=1249101 RepID=UPI003CEC3590